MTKRIGMVVVVILAAALVACSSSKAASTPTSGLTVRTVEANTKTEPPSPTATPVAAVTPSPVGFANPGVNAASFPAPPANPKPEPGSTRGISRLNAPKLGVNHYIEIVGIVNNEMQAPDDGVYAVGWFPEYGLPGAGGNVVMTAHETWNHQQGPFYGLHNATLGDDVEVKMSDGRTLVYKVISNKRYTVDNIPMGDVIWPNIRPKGEEWLTMLTCGGRIVYGANGFGEYLDRDVVVARRVK